MNRKIWITGASSGIGRALALRLARAATSSRRARGAAASSRLGSPPRLCRAGSSPFPVDVADGAAMARAVSEIEAAIGPLDLAVFNAGTHEPVELESFDPAPFRRLMEINYMGAVNGLAAVLPRFIARRAGHVAVVSSVAGYRGLPSASAYGPTKAALINLCESLKPDLDRFGVKISVVNPGFVRTPLTDRNPFPMPFLMEVDDPAARLAAGLDKGKFEITFPRRFTYLVKLARMLPYRLSFRLVKRATRR